MATAYLALLFGKVEEIKEFAIECADVIKRVSDGQMKRAESAASTTAIAFVSDLPREQLLRHFNDLWRREQRLWVVPLDGPIIIDAAIMDWVRKHTS